jgi:glycosyltransferase involved in cell wall biosynthesis
MVALKIVLITYEFTYSPFSGNGILSRSLVQSLEATGAEITVWCCRPHADDRQVLEESTSSWTAIPLTLPADVQWKRVDHESGWKHFVFTNLSTELQKQLLQAVNRADIIASVDWTGAYALRSLPTPKVKPAIYFNYRVFAQGVKDSQLQEWYNQMETEALQSADLVVALSHRDKMSLMKLVSSREVVVLLPPLRQDMAALTARDEPAPLPPELAWVRSMCLVTCVVRLSPEKDVMRFVRFLKSIQDLLQQEKWTVVLAGARADPSYADEVESRLRIVCPNAVILTHSFLSPATMVSIYQRSVLNFHPCAYDAYGMTIIEAGACGVPSVVSSEGVGALDLLGESCIRVEMTQHDGLSLESIRKIRRVLADASELERIGTSAKSKALEWDEQAYGQALLSHMKLRNPNDS